MLGTLASHHDGTDKAVFVIFDAVHAHLAKPAVWAVPFLVFPAVIHNQPLSREGALYERVVARTFVFAIAHKDGAAIRPRPRGRIRCGIMHGVGGTLPVAMTVRQVVPPLSVVYKDALGE